MPVISSPTRSRYSSNIMSRSASRIRWRITCLAVCAAMRPKSSGVTSRSSIWSLYCSNFAGSISGSGRLDHLPRLGVDRRVLVDRLDDQVRLEALGDDQLDDAEVARSRGRARRGRTSPSRAASCRPTAARPRGRCASFSGEMPFSRASAVMASRISRDMAYSSTRFDRVMSAYGMAMTPVSAAIVTASSEAPTSSPGEACGARRGRRACARGRAGRGSGGSAAAW